MSKKPQQINKQAQNSCYIKNKRRKKVCGGEASLQKSFTGVLFCPKKQQKLIISADVPELQAKTLVLQVNTSEDLALRKFM